MKSLIIWCTVLLFVMSCSVNKYNYRVNPLSFLNDKYPNSKFYYQWKTDKNLYSFGDLQLKLKNSTLQNLTGYIASSIIIDSLKNIQSIKIEYLKAYQNGKVISEINPLQKEIIQVEKYNELIFEYFLYVNALPLYERIENKNKSMLTDTIFCFLTLK